MATYEYDVIVVGGGAAGLTASGISANLGAKTMMIEAHRLGGDCTWTGCVPSKTLLKAGKVARQIREASQFGLIDSDPEINFKKVIRHVHKIREEIYEEADQPEIFEAMGIDVVFGKASFLNSHTLQVEMNEGVSRKVSAKFIFIATGSRTAVPKIEGLESTGYLTNESLFEIEDLPKELMIIGAGPLGVEMSQAFANLGSQVKVLEATDRIMPKDDPESEAILRKVLEGQGVVFETGVSITGVSSEEGKKVIHYQKDGTSHQVTGSNILLATGRKPNIESLDIEKAGIRSHSKGIPVNDSCRTNVKHIYAIGDVSDRYHLTHMAEHMAKVAVTKALVKIPMKMDMKHVPWVTYTHPELGQVGASEEELKRKGKKFEVYRFPYSKIDRALAENETEGLIKIFASKLTGKIYGVSVVGAHAGELISEYAVAMRNGVSLRKLADTIHPYPSWGLGARRAADQWYIKNQSEWSVKWIKRIFGYRGDIPDYSDKDRII